MTEDAFRQEQQHLRSTNLFRAFSAGPFSPATYLAWLIMLQNVHSKIDYYLPTALNRQKQLTDDIQIVRDEGAKEFFIPDDPFPQACMMYETHRKGASFVLLTEVRNFKPETAVEFRRLFLGTSHLTDWPEEEKTEKLLRGYAEDKLLVHAGKEAYQYLQRCARALGG